MSTLTTALAAAGAVGWSGPVVWMRRRLTAARRDPLTGLLGRDAFERRARRGMAGGARCAVLVIDLDGFKAVNDTYGHAAGDAALRAVGARLANWNSGRYGVLARLGGDEFAAVLPTRGPDYLRWRLDELHAALCEPVVFEDRRLALGASIGAVWRDRRTAVDLSVLLRRADEAMYTAKQNGGGVFMSAAPAPAYPTVNGRRAGRRGTGDGPEVAAG